MAALTLHFKCSEFSFRSDSQVIGISSIWLNALEYVIVRSPSLLRKWKIRFCEDLSIGRHKVLTTVTLYRIHFHRKFRSMHSTRNPLSSRLNATVQNPTTASEQPAKKKKLRPGQLNVPFGKVRLFYAYMRQPFSLQSFYLRNVDERSATQKKCTKINRRRHKQEARGTHIYITCKPMRRQRRNEQTQMNFPISRSFL